MTTRRGRPLSPAEKLDLDAMWAELEAADMDENLRACPGWELARELRDAARAFAAKCRAEAAELRKAVTS